MHVRTLRLRFASWIAGLLFAMLTVFGLSVYLILSRGLSAALDDSLRLSASQAEAAVNSENGVIDFTDSLPESSSIGTELRSRGLTIRLLSPDGKVLQSIGLYRTLPVRVEGPARQPAVAAGFSTIEEPARHEPVRFFALPVLQNGQVVALIQVGQSLASVSETLNRLLVALLVGGPLLILLGALGGYILASRALAPINQITRTARRISAENLNERLNVSTTDDEVGQLAGTIDGMLDRLSASFHRERQFTADASHELRTPVAAMQAILGVARSKRRTVREYTEALADISEEADRLRTLVDGLLQLARSDAPHTQVREPVDLAALLGDVTESLRPLARAKALALACTIPGSLSVTGDRDALVRLFVNLLDNAIKFTPRGLVQVAARVEGSEILLTVSDTGIGIAPKHLPRIFDRFYRVDRSRSSGGTGLGLALAREITLAHGGMLEVRSTPGSGTTFTVRLPG
jgi:heavy metal sensor kinase